MRDRYLRSMITVTIAAARCHRRHFYDHHTDVGSGAGRAPRQRRRFR